MLGLDGVMYIGHSLPMRAHISNRRLSGERLVARRDVRLKPGFVQTASDLKWWMLNGVKELVVKKAAECNDPSAAERQQNCSFHFS